MWFSQKYQFIFKFYLHLGQDSFIVLFLLIYHYTGKENLLIKVVGEEDTYINTIHQIWIMYVLVSLSCHNKIPRTGWWLKQQKFISQSSRCCSTCQLIQFPVRTFFLLYKEPPSHCATMRDFPHFSCDPPEL